MLGDVANLVERGNAADDFVSLAHFGLPGREMTYCKGSNAEWEETRVNLIAQLQAKNATDVDVHAITNAFAGFYDSCIGTDDGQFFQAEIAVVMMMLLFFMLESHAENSELFLREWLFASAAAATFAAAAD